MKTCPGPNANRACQLFLNLFQQSRQVQKPRVTLQFEMEISETEYH